MFDMQIKSIAECEKVVKSLTSSIKAGGFKTLPPQHLELIMNGG